MRGITDRNPGLLHEVQVAGKTFHRTRLKIQRVVRDQHLIIRLAHNLERAMDTLKEPVPRADVIMRFRCFEMLPAVVQLNVAGGGCFVGFVVVFHMVRAEPRVGVANVHISFRRGHVALARLRFGFEFSHRALCRRRVNLLGRSVKEKARSPAGKHRQVEKTTERSMNLCPKMMFHPGHGMESKR